MKAEHKYKCIICGKADARTLSGKTTCNICFEKQKENRSACKPRAKKHKRKRVSTMPKIYEITKLATAEGLTYGQYVAKHRYDNRISNETNEKEIK